MLKDMHGGGQEALNNCKVFCCELGSNFVKIAHDFVGLTGLSDVVQIVKGEAAESLKKIKGRRMIDKD